MAVALFNPAAFETPESIQFDRRGNIYLSMALTGEVRQIAPDGTQTSLAFPPIRPDVQPCGNSFGLPIMGGLAPDHRGNVYVSVNSCNVPDIGATAGSRRKRRTWSAARRARPRV